MYLIVVLLSMISIASCHYEALAQPLPFSNPLSMSTDALAQPYNTVLSTKELPTAPKPNRYARLIDQSAYVVTVQATGIALMTMLPKSMTHFNKAKLRKDTPLVTWEKHVSHKPVIDNDPFMVNASHAFLAGSGYHVLCRKLHYTLGECFVYSAIMSTIHEYVVEAFPEPPSIQDLIVTPIGGFVIGELLYVLGIPHPLVLITKAMDSALGPVVHKHNIRFEVVYGNVGAALERSHERHYREMVVVLKGNF